jgi:hypothetical protein
MIDDDDDCGAIGGMRIGRGNRSTRRKHSPMPLCPPQIPHDMTRARTRTAADTYSVGVLVTYHGTRFQLSISNSLLSESILYRTFSRCRHVTILSCTFFKTLLPCTISVTEVRFTGVSPTSQFREFTRVTLRFHWCVN